MKKTVALLRGLKKKKNPKKCGGKEPCKDVSSM